MSWLSGWENRIKCTIDNTNVDDTLSNFPVLLHISATSGISAADLTAFFTELAADANRKKIAVTTNDGTTECYVEIERFDYANLAAWLWVKVPSVASGSVTELYLYYDSAQADNTTYIGDTTDAVTHNVWDANFVGVWHMAQDPNGDVTNAIKDSTSNQNDGTPAGSMTTADLVEGEVGKALEFDGVNDKINIVDSSDWSFGTGPFTLEALVKFTGFPTSGNRMALIGSNDGVANSWFFGLYNNSGTLQWNFNNYVSGYTINIQEDAISLSLDTWYYVVVNRSGDSWYIYQDENQCGTEDTNTSAVADVSSVINLGSTGGVYLLNGIQDETRNTKGDARSAAWIKATYYSNWDALITFEYEVLDSYIDLTAEIKASEEVITDLSSEIITGLESLTDLNSEIITGGTSLIDLKSDIAADFLTAFENLSTEISAKAQEVIDLLTDIRATTDYTFEDLLTEIECKAYSLHDLNTEIKASDYAFYSLKTSIEAVRSKWWLKSEIKAGCAARYSFNTEWNPNRFLITEIEAKKLHEFSFNTVTGSSYAATSPQIEILTSSGIYPLRTLFLDYLSVGGINEYTFKLWWGRGLGGGDALKNAKIKAEYINTTNGGGLEVITCDWVSCKIEDEEYQTVNETPVNLGDILADSYLNLTLKVECRDCSLSRGLIFFRLVFTGDLCESIFGDKVVYNDGSRYFFGNVDDYESQAFVARLYVVT